MTNSLWANIPQALQNLPQWCVSVLPSKAPLIYNANAQALVNADVSSGGPYHTFNDACNVANAYGGVIGFVFLGGNGLAVIDFDVKDVVNEPDKPHLWTEKHDLEFFESTLSICNTYAEISSGGRGVHIIAMYNDDYSKAGRKGASREVYTDKRYMIFTGNVVSDIKYVRCFGRIVPHVISVENKQISEQTRLINLVLDTIRAVGQNSDVELIEKPQTLDDAEVYRRASIADNGEKFLKLWAGEWAGDYPSQSEADLSLMSMFTYYSEANEQCRRLFLMSGLGKRGKAQNPAYVNRTIRITRARQEREAAAMARVNIQGLLETQRIRVSEQLKSKEVFTQVPADVKEYVNSSFNQVKQSHVEYHQLRATQKPELDGIEWPQGLLGELAYAIYKCSYQSIKEVSIVAALGMFAGICGKLYQTPTRTGTNLYLILLANSGVGKDGLHTGMGSIKNAIQYQNSGIVDYIDSTNYVSGPALSKKLAENTCFANFSGEWGRKLKRMAMEDSRDGPMIQLRSVLTEIFQKSGPTSTHSGAAHSNKDNNVSDVYGGVAYTLVGESTPITFYDSITQSMIEDGFLSRLLTITYDGKRPPANEQLVIEPDPVLISRLAQLTRHAMIEGARSHIFANYKGNAQAIFDEYRKECDEKINHYEDEGVTSIYTRAHLKALRVATLLAVGENYTQPMIDERAALWSIDLVNRHNDLLISKMGTGDIGVSDNNRLKKLLHILREYINKAPLPAYKVPEELHGHGVILYRYLQNRLHNISSYSQYRMGSNQALDHTLRTAIDAGYVVECNRNEIAKKYGAQGRCFQIINLPDE